MSLIFSENFAARNFNNWDVPGIVGGQVDTDTLRIIDYDENIGFTCFGLYAEKIWSGSAYGPSGTFRFRAAAMPNAISPDISNHFAWRIRIGANWTNENNPLPTSHCGIPAEPNISVEVLCGVDGAMLVSTAALDGSGNTSATAGTFPIDGDLHGVRINWTLSLYDRVVFGNNVETLGLDADVYIDDVLVISFIQGRIGTDTCAFSGGHFPSKYLPVWNNILVSPGKIPPPTAFGTPIGLITDIEVYDDIDNTSYLGRNLIPNYVGTLCFNQCIPVLSVDTPMTYDCVTNRFTITGTGFISTARVEIMGPEDQLLPNLSVISVTSTQIVVENADTTENGTYCANVFNC